MTRPSVLWPGSVRWQSPSRGVNAWIPRDGSRQVGPGTDEAVFVGVHDGLNAVAQLELAERTFRGMMSLSPSGLG